MIVKKDLKSMSDSVLEPYKNFKLFKCNDSHLRMSVNKGVYDWHKHDNSEELFIVLEGCLFIDTDISKTYKLGPYDFLKIPRGVLHRTRSNERTVNLTFERKDMKTNFLPFDQNSAIKTNELKIQNIESIAKGVTEGCKIFELELINNHMMKLGVNTGIFNQHNPSNTDELLIGIEGETLIKSHNNNFSLKAGEILLVVKDTNQSYEVKERTVSVSFSEHKADTIFIQNNNK